MKKIKCGLVGMLTLFLSGCGCYETYEAAWDACNSKYNGKCSYLGDDYKVCKSDRTDIFGNKKCVDPGHYSNAAEEDYYDHGCE